MLKATLKGPWRGSQRPTRRRPHKAKELRRQRATSPIFSPERAARQGDRRLDVAFIEGSAIAIASSMGLLLMDVATTLR